MKKIALFLVLSLLLTAGVGCGKKKTEEQPKQSNQQQQQQGQAPSPQETTFPPASAEDKADLEKAMKDFWAALNEGDEKAINAMIYKSEADTAKQIKEGLTKAEVKSFEFEKLTGVTANNGLAAVGYVVMREMGEGMKTKFPEIQVLPFVKEKEQWKIVLSQDVVTPEEVSILTSMIMQEQKKMSDDIDMVSYQKQQEEFEKEAEATKQKFYLEAVKQQEEAAKQQQGGMGGGGMQKPANHP